MDEEKLSVLQREGEYLCKEVANSGLFADIFYVLKTREVLCPEVTNGLFISEERKTIRILELLEYLKEDRSGIFKIFIELLLQYGLSSLVKLLDPRAFENHGSIIEGNNDICGSGSGEPPAASPTYNLPSLPHRSSSSSSISESDRDDNENNDPSKPLDVNVTPAKVLGGSRHDKSELYKNESSPRGLVFIANYKKFKDEENVERKGSEKDVAHLYDLFTQMGYKIPDVHLNLSKYDTIKALREFRDSEEHKAVDSCIVVIMSHGRDGKSFYTSDNQHLTINDVVERFSNNECEYLRGKPKIFIFQYCRGTVPDIGVMPTPVIYKDAGLPVETDAAYISVVDRDPTFSDMYIVYSTVEGFVSFRHPERGSWLIEAICNVFMRYSHFEELDSLMKRVSRQVRANYSNEGNKQVCEYVQKGFDRYFYFNPRPLNNGVPQFSKKKSDFVRRVRRFSTTAEREPGVPPPVDDESLPSPSSADPRMPSTSGDYFQDVLNDFEDVIEGSVVSSLEKRLEVIEEVRRNEGVENKDSENPSCSRMRSMDTDMVQSIFHDNAGLCSMPKCLGKLELQLINKHGNMSAIVKCKICEFEKTYRPKSLDEQKNLTEYNISLVYRSFEEGKGHAGYRKMCAKLGHTPLGKNAYYKVKDFIGSKIIDFHKSKQEFLYQCLVTHYKTLGRFPDENGILDIDVSFDGSWLTTGHNSHIGLGAVVDVHLGFIIDFHVCCNYCVVCSRYYKKKENNKITKDLYLALMSAHKDSCNKNCDKTASSVDMEAEAAEVLWGRSFQHKLRYVNIIGDYDSSAYDRVCAMNNNKGPYDNVRVEKQECVNHVGKTIGSRLRKIRDEMFIWQTEKHGKQYKRKPLSGRHKLTENVINYLAINFGVVVRKCTNKTVKEFKDLIMAIFYHCASTDESPKHHLCPKGPDSYCFYNEALAQKKKPKSHKNMVISFRLNDAERKVVLQVFREMCRDDLLHRCLMGKTQNPNESLHSKIWLRLPKVYFFRRKTVQQSVCLSVLQHNWGYTETYPLLKIGFGNITSLNLKHLKKQDSERKRHSIKTRKRKGSRQKKGSKKRVVEDQDYAAGSF